MINHSNKTNRPVLGLTIVDYQNSYSTLIWSSSGCFTIPLYPQKMNNLTSSSSSIASQKKSTINEELETVCIFKFFIFSFFFIPN